MVDLPKITIVTPSYNQARYLEVTIQSVLTQGYPNLEYIVMDGGSSDGSVEIIKKYSGQLTYWKTGPDNGQADAIYRGFELSTGQIIGWVNSDDILLPGSLINVAQYFKKHPDKECVVGGCLMIDSNSKIIMGQLGLPRCNLGTRVTYKKLLFHTTEGFNQPAAFWLRKSFFEVGGFDTQLKFCFDYDLFLRLAKRKPFGLLKEYLACFRVHPQSKTANLGSIMEAENEILKQRFGFYEHYWIQRYTMNKIFKLFALKKRWEMRIKHLLKSSHIPDISFQKHSE